MVLKPLTIAALTIGLLWSDHAASQATASGKAVFDQEMAAIGKRVKDTCHAKLMEVTHGKATGVRRVAGTGGLNRTGGDTSFYSTGFYMPGIDEELYFFCSTSKLGTFFSAEITEEMVDPYLTTKYGKGLEYITTRDLSSEIMASIKPIKTYGCYEDRFDKENSTCKAFWEVAHDHAVAWYGPSTRERACIKAIEEAELSEKASRFAD